MNEGLGGGSDTQKEAGEKNVHAFSHFSLVLKKFQHEYMLVCCFKLQTSIRVLHSGDGHRMLNRRSKFSALKNLR